ncbi:MAG TPA: periplasmic heavy metal sensor [Kofleriaceae bacterium]|nr:periplasmic heavy metal sensor [Kofleriaceae bacterium]
MRRAHRRCHGGYYGYCGPGGYGSYGGDSWDRPFGDGGDGGDPGAAGCGPSWQGRRPGRWQPGRRKGRRMLYALLSRIEASPAQERAIIAEIEQLRDRVRGAKLDMGAARGDLAAALRGAVFDDAALGAVLGRVDTATGEVRAAVIDAVRAIHSVLDDRQRAQVADLVEHGGGWWRRRSSPARA